MLSPTESYANGCISLYAEAASFLLLSGSFSPILLLRAHKAWIVQLGKENAFVYL